MISRNNMELENAMIIRNTFSLENFYAVDENKTN